MTLAEAAVTEEQEETNHNEPITVAKRPQRQRTMEEFWRPIIRDEYSAVKQPTIEANNFELKPALITMVQQHQFTGHPSEDPNEHLGRFLRMANIVKLNGVRPVAVVSIFIEGCCSLLVRVLALWLSDNMGGASRSLLE